MEIESVTTVTRRKSFGPPLPRDVRRAGIRTADTRDDRRRPVHRQPALERLRRSAAKGIATDRTLTDPFESNNPIHRRPQTRRAVHHRARNHAAWPFIDARMAAGRGHVEKLRVHAVGADLVERRADVAGRRVVAFAEARRADENFPAVRHERQDGQLYARKTTRDFVSCNHYHVMKTFIWSWRLMCRWLVEAYLDNTTGLASMMAYDLLALAVAPGLFLLSVALVALRHGPDAAPPHHRTRRRLPAGNLARHRRAAGRRAGHHGIDEPRGAILGYPAGDLPRRQSDQHRLAHAQPLPGHSRPETLVVEPLDHRAGAPYSGSG